MATPDTRYYVSFSEGFANNETLTLGEAETVAREMALNGNGPVDVVKIISTFKPSIQVERIAYK